MQVIQIQPLAASKPILGQACNGCGVCCLSEPCPLGMVLSGRRMGACEALRWETGADIYRCGAMMDSQAVLHQALPLGMKFFSTILAPLLRKLAQRWIAAGTGCDCDLEVSSTQFDRQSDT